VCKWDIKHIILLIHNLQPFILQTSNVCAPKNGRISSLKSCLHCYILAFRHCRHFLLKSLGIFIFLHYNKTVLSEYFLYKTFTNVIFSFFLSFLALSPYLDVTCREPPVVANGDILVARSQVYLPGQEVRYECHEGFEISGPKTIRCENKTWSDPPTCEDVRCPPPPDILNGWLRGNKKQKYSPNETMQYQCDNGYYISGSRTITCSKKQWSTAPQCKANTEKCGRPPSIENGDIRDLLKEQYESGERVIYKCQRYYNMEGDAAVSCQNGHWSDTPKCIVPCTASQEDMERNNIRLRWTGKDKLYSTAGDVAEFSCKWGYRPDPSSPEFRVQCVNGTFEYPQCIRAQI
uniref:Sushi domain-containing protein n=1 Tax=Anolis carolinensis TaxID=28377 RepID=R4GC56_ANOCA